MTNEEKLKLIAIAGLTVFAVNNYFNVRNTERAKRAKIAADSQKHIEAIWRAGKRMEKKIESGEYEITGVDALRNDFEFEIIAAHYE